GGSGKAGSAGTELLVVAPEAVRGARLFGQRAALGVANDLRRRFERDRPIESLEQVREETQIRRPLRQAEGGENLALVDRGQAASLTGRRRRNPPGPRAPRT